MTDPGCTTVAFADLADYAAGELPDTAAAALEEHLFSCADCARRAADVDALARAVGLAVRSGEVGGFVTDAVLNRLSRDGVRLRTFALSPGAVVPCAVWQDDELMVLRLRGDFAAAGELTLSQRAGGQEVSRTTGQMATGSQGEVLFATPAAWVRELSPMQLDLVLTAHDAGEERRIGTYTLVHGGSLRR
jgi:anti-sigma factor RsiW